MKQIIVISGRCTSISQHGNLIFATINCEDGRSIQITQSADLEIPAFCRFGAQVMIEIGEAIDGGEVTRKLEVVR